MRTLFVLAGILIFLNISAAAQLTALYQQASFVHKNDTLPYRILYPENFNPGTAYPLLFMLHGSGERGKDNVAQLKHGSALFLKERVRRQYPAIVVFPQCPQSSYWSSVEVDQSSFPVQFNFQTSGEATQAMNMLQGLLKEMLQQPYVNPQQVYIGGLSMGGMGTLELLRREPKIFAAAFSICGGDNLANAKKYKDTPLWLFHGLKDEIVPAALSQSLAARLEEIGAKNIKITLYPEAKHNSWENAFAEDQLLPWLFSKKR